MGLDMASNTRAERIGSYSYFNDYRNHLVSKLYGSWEEYEKQYPPGDWNARKRMYNNHSPLGLLYWHSDCDGYLTKTDCKKLIKELEDIYVDYEYEETHNTMKEMIRSGAEHSGVVFC
jgi:hypothetical protein